MGAKVVACAVVIVALAAASAPAAYVDDVSRKADRGFSNVLGGWLEVPYQTCTAGRQNGVLRGAPVGLGKGIGMTVGRMLSGVVDLVTFPAPFPNGWKGLIKPEYNPWVEQPAGEQAAPAPPAPSGEQETIK